MSPEQESPPPQESRKPGFLGSLFGRGSQPDPDDQGLASNDVQSAADGGAANGGAPTRIADAVAAPGTQPASNGSVIEGQVVIGESVVSSGGPPSRPSRIEPWQPPAATLRAMREQVADFAEFAHRQRVPSLPDLPALGSGGGITAAAVRAVTDVMLTQMYPGLALDKEVLTDALLRALVAPGEPRPAGVDDAPSIVSLHGRLMLDVSRAAAGGAEEPCTRLVPVDDRPESPNGSAESVPGASATPEGSVPDGSVPDGSVPDGSVPDGSVPDGSVPDGSVPDESSVQGSSADGSQVDSPGDGSGATPPAPYAAVIFGPAAAIAAGRPYLSLDDLTSYARQQAYRLGRHGDEPEAARTGIRAARGLEIVVLLDQSLGGGVWIDVDPDTGRLAAALSIELTNPAALLAGIRFRHLAAS